MPLPCNLIVFRILKKNPFDGTGRLKRRDFLLKPSDTEDGLSVFKTQEAANQCRRSLRGMNGLATLHVGRIRNLNQELQIVPELDIVDWPNPPWADHAVVANLPNPYSGIAADAERAEALAQRLSEMARIVPDE